MAPPWLPCRRENDRSIWHFCVYEIWVSRNCHYKSVKIQQDHSTFQTNYLPTATTTITTTTTPQRNARDDQVVNICKVNNSNIFTILPFSTKPTPPYAISATMKPHPEKHKYAISMTIQMFCSSENFFHAGIYHVFFQILNPLMSYQQIMVYTV